MDGLRGRLAELKRCAPPNPTLDGGLYVVCAPDVNQEPIAAFADETLADELAEALGPGASVTFEPVADNDLALLEAIVERYVEG